MHDVLHEQMLRKSNFRLKLNMDWSKMLFFVYVCISCLLQILFPKNLVDYG